MPTGPTIHAGRQGKHIRGHNNFIAGRSEFTHPDPQALVDRFAGTGTPVGHLPRGTPGFRERVDFGEIIGLWIDKDATVVLPTTKGTIHYAKDGVHIVPARP